ncbi:MAG: Gfo/Idh/MocA family oxidoreductase [Planctomycetes bacterium]|nr:Gfo/Idh/MocA family oxidoreductase [Planctomycetota bacterium]
MSRLRLAVIGTGNIVTLERAGPGKDRGGAHIPCLNELPDLFEVTAIFGTNPAKNAEAVTKVQHGLPRRFDADRQNPWPVYGELLGLDKLDAVLICTPNATHRDYAVRALEAGKHVLLEKPMEISLQKCNEILDAAKTSGRVLQIAMICRHMEFYQNVRRVIESAQLEPGYMLVEEVRGPFASAWKYDPKMSGGLLVEKACHTLDLFNWLCRKRPVRVVGLGGCDVIRSGAVGDVLGNVTRIEGASGIYDNAHVTVEYANRLRASYHICFFRNQKYGITHPLRVVGRNGEEIYGDLFDRRLRFTPGLAQQLGRPEGVMEMDYGLFSLAEAGVEQLRRFHDTVVNGAPNTAPGEEGSLAIAMCLAAQASVDRGGQPVNVQDVPGFVRT